MLVPTRGRPDNARRLLAACEATCVLPTTRIIFGVDADDPARPGYNQVVWPQNPYLPWPSAIGRGMLLPGSKHPGMVDCLNRMFRFGDTADTYGFMGDDHLPATPGWDKALCDALAGKTAALAYGNDLLQGERIPTAVAMTASIPRTLGYMAPPELAHLYVDNFWSDLGQGLGALTYLPDVIIEHLHPVAGKAEWDAGYRAVNADASFTADRVAYERYRAERLPADLAKLRAIA